MSRAFVKDADDDGALEEMPERVISEHPNFVTARGLWQIEDIIQQLEQGREAARMADDAATLGHVNRDLRYWQQRLASAQLITPEPVPTKVRFGVTVGLEFANGIKCQYTLVGEDEADPAEGLLSWVAPVAQALLGHQVGDVVTLPDGNARITALSVRP
ncbi:MAG: GreA/GreB family elongation factor [Steroidobacteraceae bacterium]